MGENESSFGCEPCNSPRVAKELASAFTARKPACASKSAAKDHRKYARLRLVKNVNPQSDAWRGWTLARLEREYSPSTCVPSINPFLEAYVERSREASTRLPCQRDLQWGEGDHEVFDFFPAASSGSPLLVFFHGGYWQEHSRTDVLFVATTCVARGIAYAAVEYTLAPAATVAEIVEQCRRAVGSIYSQAPALGFDPRRLFIGGSSAGAHLAAMLLVEGWQKTQRFPEDLVAGGILLSGVYDLEPLVPTYINQALRMTEEAAAALSPMRKRLSPAIPVILAWGQNETQEFKRQSLAFAARLKDAGFPVKSMEASGANHFDIVFEIADPGSALGRATLALLSGGTITA
jgi:arylformamidase